MGEFAEISFSIAQAEQELITFKSLLDEKRELSERQDILNRLPGEAYPVVPGSPITRG
jgi:hypothetical protein